LKHKAFREKKTGALDALVSGSIGKYRKSNVPKKPDLDRKSNEKKSTTLAKCNNISPT